MLIFAFFAIVAVGSVLLVLLVASLSSRTPRPNNEWVDITAGAEDLELVGPVITTLAVDYLGTFHSEGGRAIVRYDTTYSGGKRRISKWILARDRPYLALRGHYVLYEYFREDGSLEQDRLVFPEPRLGCVYVKQRVRFFDELNQLLEEHYRRADGTLGARSDHRTGLFQQFRSDGQRLHSEYFDTTEKGQRSIYYRRDGKTVWMEKDESENARVYFDLQGEAVDLRFTRQSVIGGYSMGPQSEPILTSYDKYTRPDGTRDYDQAWYARYDQTTQTCPDTLGAVVLYDSIGNKSVEYKLSLRAANEPRFIQEVLLHNADKTTTIRKYRSPNCRLSEDVLNEQRQFIGHQDFDATDYFQEEVKEIIFQGFIRNVRGIYDDESYDV